MTQPPQIPLRLATVTILPMSGVAISAGVQGGLAVWWEVTASLCSIDADFQGAADAWLKAVEHPRHISQLPQLEGPYKFASLANTLESLG